MTGLEKLKEELDLTEKTFNDFCNGFKDNANNWLSRVLLASWREFKGRPSSAVQTAECALYAACKLQLRQMEAKQGYEEIVDEMVEYILTHREGR